MNVWPATPVHSTRMISTTRILRKVRIPVVCAKSLACGDISVFDRSSGKGRGSNDSMNKTREAILGILHNPPPEFLADDRWVSMSGKWRSFLSTLYSDYDSLQVIPQGGRSHHVDFIIHFLLNGTIVRTINAEFKHSAKSICGLPQYLSKQSSTPYVPASYAEFFYDSYVDRICEIYPELVPHKPTRSEYISHVYKTNYACHPFFNTLYALDDDTTAERKKRKDALVKQSIKEFLALYGTQLDVNLLTQDIRKTQTEKTFILWNLTEFCLDKIHDDEMDIVGVKCVKNDNTIVAMSRSGTEHHMLLRWRNHLGILLPAWQIKLVRR